MCPTSPRSFHSTVFRSGTMDEAEDRSLSSAGESEGPEEDEMISDEERDGDEDDEEEDSDEEEASSVSSSRCGNARPLEIVVKRVGKGDNNVLSLQVDPSASVLDLKTQISQELAAKDNNDRVPVDRQRLIYFGRMLRDNEEILGNEGIKMKPKVVNYVHLSALPEGQKPSPRDNNHHRHRGSLRPSAGGLPIPAAFSFASRPATAIAGSSTSMQESHQQSLERARRLGSGFTRASTEAPEPPVWGSCQKSTKRHSIVDIFHFSH